MQSRFQLAAASCKRLLDHGNVESRRAADGMFESHFEQPHDATLVMERICYARRIGILIASTAAADGSGHWP